MLRPLRGLLLVGVVLLVSAAAVVHSRSETPVVTEELRARWNSLTEGERERLREHYAEFEQLSSAEKQRVHRRAKRLDELARQVYRSLEDDVRAELDGMGKDKRRELLREMAVERAGEMGRRILTLLPPADRTRLLAASEEDREMFFLEFEQRQAKRLDRVVREYGSEFLSEAQVARLDELGPRERRAQFLELYKRRVARWVTNRGLPESISEQRWARLLEMPPSEFRQAWERVRERYGVDAPTRRSRPSGPMQRLIAAIQGDESEHLALSELEPEERQATLRARQRERVLAVARDLHSQGVLDDDQVAELLAVDDEQYHAYLRSLAAKLGAR